MPDCTAYTPRFGRGGASAGPGVRLDRRTLRRLADETRYSFSSPGFGVAGAAGGGGAGGGGGNFLEQLFSFNFGGDKAAGGAKGGGAAADRFADDYHGFTYTRDSSLA